MKIMSIVCILNYQSFKPRLFIKKLFSEVGTFSAEKKKRGDTPWFSSDIII